MDLLSLAQDAINTNPEWYPFFADPVVINQLVHINGELNEQLNRGMEIYPSPELIFRAFALTKVSTMQVIMLGQDPYPGEYSIRVVEPIVETIGDKVIQHEKVKQKLCPYATGLAFSVPPNAPIPSSLQNIFRELAMTYHQPHWSDHGDLTYWALQGVFLLNTALTVIRNQKETHLSLWEGFIGLVIRWLATQRPVLVYLALGAKAKKKVTTTLSNPTMLTCSHPSGLSASRGESPFLGSKIFAQCNCLLSNKGLPGIDWRLPLQ